MIIHSPQITRQSGYSVAWARVELDTPRRPFPEYIWYRLPDRYAHYFSSSSDAFLVAALFPAMHYGEGLQVHGPISARLAYHLEEYQDLMSFWFPKDLRRVSLHFEKLMPEMVEPQGVGCSFSSGVDSWFTVWNHLPGKQTISGYSLTHALFINQFDITSGDSSKYESYYRRYREILGELGIDLLPLETNAVSLIIPRLKYNTFYSPVLASCALILGGLFKRFYLASGRDHYRFMRRATSSNPLSERLLSTESTELIHFGATHRRYEKLEAIAAWQPVQENLRVCGIPQTGEAVINCSACEKCTRTMVSLYALGKMSQFSTFARPFKTNHDILRWARKHNPLKYTRRALFAFVRQYRPNLIPWLWAAVVLGSLRYHLIKMIPDGIKPALRHFGFYIDHFTQEYAFDDPDLIWQIRLWEEQ